MLKALKQRPNIMSAEHNTPSNHNNNNNNSDNNRNYNNNNISSNI